MNNTQKTVKRWFDIAVSVVCLVVFSPLFLYCYILIRNEDGGPAIFSQERIGMHGKPFFIYKFRSMKVDAENNEPALACPTNDDRLTKAGAFLREHHLDELPQLWNVLKGDMSFIGPRPERKVYIDQIMRHNPNYERLYQIRNERHCKSYCRQNGYRRLALLTEEYPQQRKHSRYCCQHCAYHIVEHCVSHRGNIKI